MGKIRKKLAPIVKKNFLLYKAYLVFVRKNAGKKLLYNPKDINQAYYEKIKDLKNSDLEHQIGRLINYKKIVEECENFAGDFAEFGTWQGFSMIWIAYFMERRAIFNRKFVGLDGFVGLPYADGVFDKFGFSDTSLKLCQKNIKNSILYEETKGNILVGKFLYKEKKRILQYLKDKNIDKLCFIHIDCDVSQSAIEIFDVLLEGNLIADRAYILFDDYGCDSKLKDAIDEIFEKMRENWNIREHSKTKLTKNFFLEKIK